jgi:hypothetical protein
MGANPTQAVGVMLFLIAFTLLAGAFAGGGFLFLLGFAACLAGSVAMFIKCKPWEHGEETK